MIKWTDINDIAIELTDNHPDVDPQYVNFVDLSKWVLEIEGFLMIQIAVAKRFLKPFKWPGLKSRINTRFRLLVKYKGLKVTVRRKRDSGKGWQTDTSFIKKS